MSDDSISYVSACGSDSFCSIDSSNSLTLSLRDELLSELGPFKDKFNCCHINVQSLPQHFVEFSDTFSENVFNAILISESWLKPNLNSTAYSLPGYMLIRCDRTVKRGGGVAIYLRHNINHKILAISNTSHSDTAEFLFLEIDFKGTKAVLGVVYCPPSTDYFSDLESVLENLSSEYIHHIIMGDFNTNLLTNTSSSCKLTSILHSVSLTVLPLNPTHVNLNFPDSWIDLILTSCKDKVIKYGQLSAPCFSRHDLLFISYNLKPPKPKPTVLHLRSFSKLNLDSLLQDVSVINWSHIFHSLDINSMVVLFNKTVINIYDKHVPKKNVKLRHSPAPWITDPIRVAMKRRDKAFRKFKLNRCEDNWRHYKRLRNRCNQMIRAAKRRYIHSNVSNSSSAVVWKFLENYGIVPNSGKPKLTSFSVDGLNHHFSTVSVLDTCTKQRTITLISSMPHRVSNSFSFSSVSEEEIKKTVLSIKSNAVGEDEITRFMIVSLIDTLLPALTQIINTSLSTGIFPSPWRKAHVIPTPKVNNPTVPNELRPISILPYLSKVLEATVHKQLSSFVYNNNLISNFQSGFRPGHSTSTALLKVVEDVRDAMESGRLTVLVLIDFSNAFNSVDHDILVALLSQLNISSKELNWLSTYLRGRQQAIRMDNTISGWRDLAAGVPQGGILSPLLFSLFINSITNNLISSYHLYADDLQIYANANPTEDSMNAVIDLINKDLQRILEWCCMFGISVNPLKCQAIVLGSQRQLCKLDDMDLYSIKFNNLPIPFAQSVKNLGLYIDPTLSWKVHISEICRKVTFSLRTLYRHKNFLPIRTKTLLVQSLILPLIDYADVCCSNISELHLNKLDRLLNSCIRFIFGLRKYDHISNYRSQLKWLPIRERRSSRYLCQLFSILNNPLSPIYLQRKFNYLGNSHNLHLRSSSNLQLFIPSHHSGFRASSFTVYATKLWNGLPEHIRRSPSKMAFKKSVHQHFRTLNTH